MVLFLDEAEVNPATLLSYSEYMLAEIHGNPSGAHYEGNMLCFDERELMPDKLREVLFLFLFE